MRRTGTSATNQAPRTSDPRPSWHAILTSPWRCLPNLLVIGAQKAGTTSLHDQLGRHPAVWMSPRKECNVLTRSRCSPTAYRAFFPWRSERIARGIAFVGESTPYYLFHPDAPRRAAAILPDIRAIAILRDPVQRAWSHHRHNTRLGIETLAFEDALAAEDDRLAGRWGPAAGRSSPSIDAFRHYSYRARGRYAEQLERWFAAIGRDRTLVLFFEELVLDPEAALGRVAQFLRIQGRFPGPFPRRNQGEESGKPPAETADSLRACFRESDGALARLLGVRPPWMR